MIHPIFKVLIAHPDLIAEHLSNYLALFREEARDAVGNVARTAAAWICVAIMLLLFLIFAGMAVLLGVLHGQFHWVLVAVPAVPLVIAGIAFAIGKKPVFSPEVTEIKRQFMADATALRQAGMDHD